MTQRRTLIHRDVRYTIAAEDDMPPGRRMWGVVRARLVDELTTSPVNDPVAVRPAGAAFSSRRAQSAVRAQNREGGIVGLVGIPSVVFPQLAANGYEIGISVETAGYVRASAVQMLGPQNAFPSTFAPADLGDIALHRAPITLRGRTLRRLPAGNLVPLPGATVTITGIWRTIPAANVVVAPSPPNMGFASPPLSVARANGVDAVTAVTVTPVAGQDKQLLDDVMNGDSTIRLSNRIGIGAGSTLAIDESDDERLEILPLATVTGSTNPTQAATATLVHPLARSHARNARVRQVTITVPGGAPVDGIGIDAIAGDTTLLLTSGSTLGAATFVQISGGGATEYHKWSAYTVTSNGAGYYRLPPLSRVAQVTIEAQHPLLTSLPLTISPNYAVREQVVDLLVE